MKKATVFLAALMIMAILLSTACSPQVVSSSTTATTTNLTTLAGSAVLSISAPLDHAQYHVNLITVTGRAPVSSEKVLVNDVEAVLASDGSFAGYAILQEGENQIIVTAAKGPVKTSQVLTVGFSPALVVYLDSLPVGPDFSYLKDPIQVVGHVNKPQAVVTVNNEEVTVNADGQFSAQVFLTNSGPSGGRILAHASLNNETDEEYILFSLAENGKVGPVPGYSGFFHSRLRYDSAITLKAGQTKRLPLTLETRKDGPAVFTGHVEQVDREYSDTPLPWTPGLDVHLEPSEFTAYPNATYNFGLVFSTSPELPAGTYYLNFYQDFKTVSSGRGGIRVTVEQ